MSYIYDMTDTWNAAGTVFSAIKMNVTNSASAASSKLIDLQLAGNSLFNVDKSGNVGVGTAFPFAKLHLYDAAAPEVRLQIGTTASQGALSFYTSSTKEGAIGFTPVSAVMDISAGRTASWGGKITFTTDTSERMRITNTGDVGIGTSTPAAKFHVNSASSLISRVESETTGYAVVGAKNSSGNFYFGIDSSTAGGFGVGNYSRILFSDGAYPIVFATNAAERMRIDSAGNVGIGTSAPGAKLDVAGNIYIRTGSVLAVDTISTYTGLGLNLGAATNMVFNTASTERMRIDSAGNVGIGTSAPAAKLNVQHTVTGNVTSLLLSRSTGNQGDEQSIVWQQNDLSNLQAASIAASVDSANSGSLRFKTASGGVNTERMRIDSAGNIGIGVTPSAWGGSSKALQFSTGAIEARGSALAFNANAYFNGTNWIYSANGGASLYSVTNGGDHQWYTAPSGTAGNAITFTQRMTLTAAGRLQVPVGVDAGSGVNQVILNPKNLVFYNTSSSEGLISAADDTSTFTMMGITKDTLRFCTSSTEKMRLTTAGDLGIGTTAPAAKLEVSASSNADFAAAIFRNTSTGTAAATSIRLGNDATAAAGYIAVSGNSNSSNPNSLRISNLTSGTGSIIILANNNNTERMRIDSAGNLMVGVTTTAGDASNATTLTNGGVKTASGSVSAATATATTIFSITGANRGRYEVVAMIGNSGDASLYTAIATVIWDGSTGRIVANNGTNMTLTLSGANVQVTQTAGTTQNVSWSVQRIAL